MCASSYLVACLVVQESMLLVPCFECSTLRLVQTYEPTSLSKQINLDETEREKQWSLLSYRSVLKHSIETAKQ